MEYYRKRVEYYFESEYSDFPLLQVVEQIRVCVRGEGDPSEPIPSTIGELEDSEKQSQLRAKWKRKIDQVVRAYFEADKTPSEAAQKLAKLLSAYSSRPLLRGCPEDS